MPKQKNRALFQCNQLSDESHDSFLARADVLWTKLMAQKVSLEDLQAYVTLRGSLLSSEDKKRVIIDSDNSLEGKLTMLKGPGVHQDARHSFLARDDWGEKECQKPRYTISQLCQ